MINVDKLTLYFDTQYRIINLSKLELISIERNKMRDKKYIKQDIERHEASIEKLPKERLGFLLRSLQLLGCKDTIKIGHFNFYASKHDTGVSVRVYIENDGETFDVINGTYWYNQGQYGHNKFTHNKGAWDSAFDLSVAELRKKAKTLYLSRIERLNKELSDIDEFESDKKKRFEALF